MWRETNKKVQVRDKIKKKIKKKVSVVLGFKGNGKQCQSGVCIGYIEVILFFVYFLLEFCKWLTLIGLNKY